MELPFLWISFGASVLALAFIAYLAKYVMSKPQGNEKMIEISLLIQQGAKAFLKREYTYVSVFVVVIAVLITVGLASWETAAAFVVGAIASACAGVIGMSIATRANARTTAAAESGGVRAALDVAISGGAVMGMGVVGVALLGLVIVYKVSGGDPVIVNGYAMGASLVALFRPFRRRNLHQGRGHGRGPRRQG